MASVTHRDALRPVLAHSPRNDAFNDADPLGLDDFEAEMKRLAAANEELLSDLHRDEEDLETSRPTENPMAAELLKLQLENAELKARIEELESAPAVRGDDGWLERQHEYEMLLEEKSEVIRSLHQKVQELQENAGPRDNGSTGANMGQAEEILRLKREMDEQRRQLDQDEADMMEQLRKMEMTMAKERAEMSRQRQEISRLQADLAHEIEQTSRDPALKERLQNLRRTPGGSKPNLQLPPIPKPEPVAEPRAHGKDSSSFFRRIFG
ncbi:MAG: hypothetical protein JO317_06675 [Verrucomicrobiae bacterium]|nr:hypothetical protein [Verrucomicrobiae bacterium]